MNYPGNYSEGESVALYLVDAIPTASNGIHLSHSPGLLVRSGFVSLHEVVLSYPLLHNEIV